MFVRQQSCGLHALFVMRWRGIGLKHIQKLQITPPTDTHTHACLHTQTDEQIELARITLSSEMTNQMSMSKGTFAIRMLQNSQQNLKCLATGSVQVLYERRKERLESSRLQIYIF